MRTYVIACCLLAGCLAEGDPDSLSSTENALAGTDHLAANEVLLPNQRISAGATFLAYQSDNNLVLYRNNQAIWATNAGLGAPTNRFVMQADCNAVVYGANGYVWASNTNGRGSNCVARVIDGDWFICSGSTRVYSARGGGSCTTDAPWTGGGGLEVMPRIGGNAGAVAAYLVHALRNTDIRANGLTRSYWDMIDHGTFAVALGNNGTGINSYRVFFHYTGEGHTMIAHAQGSGQIRFRNASNGTATPWFGFTSGGPLDPTQPHPNMDHSFKSLFDESGKGLCIQPQWNNNSTVGEVDIDFHRQTEVVDHNRLDNSDPLTTSSGGGKNNNAYFLAAWGTPPGLPHYTGPMTVSASSRGPVYDFHNQRNMAGYSDLVPVLAGRSIAVATGSVAVPR